MTQPKKNTSNVPLLLGIMGFIAGIALLFSDNWFMGLFGSIASAGLAYKGYEDLKKSKSDN